MSSTDPNSKTNTDPNSKPLPGFEPAPGPNSGIEQSPLPQLKTPPSPPSSLNTDTMVHPWPPRGPVNDPIPNYFHEQRIDPIMVRENPFPWDPDYKPPAGTDPNPKIPVNFDNAPLDPPSYTTASHDTLGPNAKIDKRFFYPADPNKVFPWKDEMVKNNWNGFQPRSSRLDSASAALVGHDRQDDGPIPVIVTNARNLTDDVNGYAASQIHTWHDGTTRPA